MLASHQLRSPNNCMVASSKQSVHRVKVRSSGSGAAADYTSADRDTLQANQNKGN